MAAAPSLLPFGLSLPAMTSPASLGAAPPSPGPFKRVITTSRVVLSPTGSLELSRAEEVLMLRRAVRSATVLAGALTDSFCVIFVGAVYVCPAVAVALGMRSSNSMDAVLLPFPQGPTD